MSGWNVALIAVGVILFVAGVCGSVVLAVLLSKRIKASGTFSHHLSQYIIPALMLGKVKWWYWLLVATSAVATLACLTLWIALSVYHRHSSAYI